MSLITRFVAAICCVTIFLLKAFGQTEVYGDIYPVSWDLAPYETIQNSENKCYQEKPAFYYQAEENVPVTGNASTPFYHRFEVCCEGYKRSPRYWHKCLPDCSVTSPDNCRNGFCRSPQNCECFEGFVKNYQGACVHTCPIACENGRCLLNGVCICKPGYVLDIETRKFCVPDCSRIPCALHQTCVEPDVCACDKGYKWSEDLGCQPICVPHCGHGRCVAPNDCECFAGFFKRPGRNICEAECYLNCANGYCESRFKCQCHAGFNYDSLTSSCLPDCQGACEHGVCTAPGVCKCFEGYKLQDNVCVPVCENDCGPYGKCVAPNKCACGEGLHLCINGMCDIRGQCICPRGMSHFVDQCFLNSNIINSMYSYDQREFYNTQLEHEFDALIGRLFIF